MFSVLAPPGAGMAEAGAATVDLGERGRFQCLAVLQFLQAKGLLEAYVALEAEAGVRYVEGSLPTAGVLEASLDMFANYQDGGAPGGRRGAAGPDAAAAAAAEAELLKLERGACCMGPLAGSSDSPDPLPANVTAVCWAATRFDEFLALAASADKRLRLLDIEGQVLAEFTDLASPVLGLDVCPVADAEAEHEVLATSMGGEVSLLKLTRPAPGGGAWSLELVQRFRDHCKHASAGRFAPLPPGADGGARARHFVTVSRDHTAALYARGGSGNDAFAQACVVRLPGEVTSCCWASAETFVLAARDDHQLHYWDVAGAAGGGPQERFKTNLNALGDSMVSFTVLALAMSPNGKLIAACTDKSRVILLQAFTNRQLRNMYGAVVEEYDTPSVCFSLDGTFVYATSSLPSAGRKAGDAEANVGMCGQVAVFEVRTGELVLQLPCHTRAVRCMDRHRHAEALVTGSFDKTVRYWG